MSNLNQLFDEATANAPASRLSIEDVVAAIGKSRRHRRQRTALAAMSALVIAATGSVVLAANFTTRLPPADEVRQPAIVWASRGDAKHLYLIKDTCRHDPSAEPFGPTGGPACNELLASSDGGMTWLSRGRSEPPRVLGPLTLMRYARGDGTLAPEADPSVTFEVSTDGGATWRRLPVRGTPVDAMPPGGGLVEGFGTGLTVYDPAQRRLRDLARQPNLRVTMLGEVAVTGPEDIWVSGLNPATLRPAVAVSHDGGSTWIERDLPGAAVIPQPTLSNGKIDPNQASGDQMKLITGDSTTAYVAYWDGSPRPSPEPPIPGIETVGLLRTYRTTDGGITWQAVSANSTTPSYASAWTTADGRIVVSVRAANVGGAHDIYAVSGDGITYAPIAMTGLPASLNFIDGSTAFSNDAMYISDDGTTWREVWRG